MEKSHRSRITFPVMEQRIWSKLPVELLEHILSFLPHKTFFNLRSTCKHFNSLIFSPSFISKHSSKSSSPTQKPKSPPPFSSFLLLSHPQFHHRFQLYDSINGHWRNLAPSRSLPSTYGQSHLLSSSNGLLCFYLPNSSSFLICNILARSSRLIRFPIFPFAFESLTLVSSSHGYEIFVLSSTPSSKLAFVYNSRVHTWNRYSGFIDSILSEISHREGILCNGNLYFTTLEPFSIVGFELGTGKWETMRTELPEELTFVRLVNGGEGKLYMVGGLGRNGISRNMKLWELNGEGMEWIEVGSLPELMCRKFMSICYHNYEHVYCVWHEGMVCVCCNTWPEIFYYKESRQTWHWVPKSPCLPDKWSFGFKWFSFVPDLYMLV